MGEAVFDAISSAVDGTFEGGNFEYGFADGYLVVDREGSEVPLTAEAEADLAKYQEMLTAGEIVAPFSEEDLDVYLDSLE
jgi:basic membrane lipoprotein Med (substrate-binding protein (PBP1-ABC) superfamily)